MDMDKIRDSEDLDQLNFYLEYVDQIIEMYAKRGLSVEKLEAEKALIINRIEEVDV